MDNSLLCKSANRFNQLFTCLSLHFFYLHGKQSSKLSILSLTYCMVSSNRLFSNVKWMRCFNFKTCRPHVMSDTSLYFLNPFLKTSLHIMLFHPANGMFYHYSLSRMAVVVFFFFCRQLLIFLLFAW